MRRRRHRNVEPLIEETSEQALCRRVRRFRRRGEHRRAFLALRDAAHTNERDPRLWALFGAQCWRMGKVDQAHKAFSHAVWLRERGQEHRKAAVTRQLLEQLHSQPLA